MSRTLFISDLHLDPERPTVTELFLDFLRAQADGTDAIYILGDLFEAWIGDDDDTSPGPEVCRALNERTRSGTSVFLMHGNRDFLLGERFAQQSGSSLLGDPTVIDLYGTPTLLMHGDLLCTDDTAYQQFRAQVRRPEWQQSMLTRPLDERRQLAREMRAASRAQNSNKPESIMDVNPDAVSAAMLQHDTWQLIHGHTHRPGVHAFNLAGKPARRIVLGDWHEHGSVLECSPDTCQLQEVGPPVSGSGI